MIVRVVAALSPLTPHILLAAPSDRLEALAPTLPPGVVFLPDIPEVWGPGPGGAIRRLAASGPMTPLLIVPGDMPWITTESMERFMALASASGSDVAVPFWASGETEHLLQWHPESSSRATYGHAPEGGGRSARASELLRSSARTLLVPIGALDRSGRSFAHLTLPSDVVAPRPRGSVDPAAPIRCLVGTPKQEFREARAAELRNDLAAALRSYRREAEWYGHAGLPLLSRHAAADAAFPNP